MVAQPPPRRPSPRYIASMSALPRTADVVVVGGGIVGLTVALELRRRRPRARIVLLDKERRLGMHASGRNSGVLHAGFYYSADSLKAKLTRDGNQRLAGWCDEHGVTVRRCGKLVVARNEAEHAGLDTLLERGRANGVPLEAIDEAEALRIEPLARTAGRALWSPSTRGRRSTRGHGRDEPHMPSARGSPSIAAPPGAHDGDDASSPAPARSSPATSSTPRACTPIASHRPTASATGCASSPSAAPTSTRLRARPRSTCTSTPCQI